MTDTLRFGSAQDAGLSADRLDLIRTRAAQWVAGGRTPSLVLLVARNGVVALHEAFGTTAGAPVATDSVFPVASISKPVVATAIMMLVEDGVISLNRPLREYVPEVSGKWTERIVVHQLLTHTSGLIDAFKPFMDLPEPAAPCEANQHPLVHRRLHAGYGRDCFKKPGEQQIYTNFNFMLLGEILRRATGQNLAEFAQQRIFGRLGMTSSSFRLLDHLKPRLVAHPEPDFILTQPLVLEAPSAPAGLKSTALDLARFAEMYRNGGRYGGARLLNEWTTREMTRNQIPGIGCVGQGGTWVPEASWGLGWMVQGDARWRGGHGILQPRGTYYHQGGGMGCAIWVDPEHDLVGVYLSVSLDWDFVNPVWEFDIFQNMATAAVV